MHDSFLSVATQLVPDYQYRSFQGVTQQLGSIFELRSSNIRMNSVDHAALSTASSQAST